MTAVSYYNISAVEQRNQSSDAAVNNSMPRSEETDYRVNDGHLQVMSSNELTKGTISLHLKLRPNNAIALHNPTFFGGI